MLNNKNKSHVKRAKKYCEKHEQLYSHHKCKPIWDKDGNLTLTNAELKITNSGTDWIQPDYFDVANSKFVVCETSYSILGLLSNPSKVPSDFIE